MTTVPEQLLDRLRGCDRVVITSHVHPDGDAVGSSLGLARILRRLGKGSLVWHRDDTPQLYRPLPASEAIHVGAEAPPNFPDGFDAAVVLECPTLDRTGLEEALGELPIVNIDHHLGNAHYGAANWIDTAAPSVGEMVFRLARALKATLDAQTATTLYLTLVTDTGGFRFANASPEAFDAAAELVREGARPEQVAEWLYEQRPEGAVRLLGEMLGTLQLSAGGRVASVRLDRRMFERAGAGDADSEGLIDTPRSIAGVCAVALVREVEAPEYKVSLRSRGDIDVQKIAIQHGGGGHKNAAGFGAEGEAEAIRAAAVAELEEALGS